MPSLVKVLWQEIITNPWDCKAERYLCQLCINTLNYQNHSVYVIGTLHYQGRDNKTVYAWNVKNTEYLRFSTI